MIFKKIETVKYQTNLSSVFKNSQNAYSERSGYIIKIYFDDYCGCGEASPLPFFSKENIKQVEWKLEELKASLMIGNSYSIEELYLLFEIFSKDCPSLKFALDIALSDILSQMKGVSLAKHLNKNAIEKINLSAININNIQPGSSIKIKFGVNQLYEDIKILNSISKKNPDLSLRIDFNRLCKLEDAVLVCDELKDCNIEYIEEPLQNSYKKDYSKLKDAISQPIALDESILDGSYKELVDLKLIDYAILKPALFGGIKEIKELYKYLNKNMVKLIISSSLQTKVGNMSEINLAASLRLNDQHGLNNYAFFDSGYEAFYNANSFMIDLKEIVGLGACYND